MVEQQAEGLLFPQSFYVDVVVGHVQGVVEQPFRSGRFAVIRARFCRLGSILIHELVLAFRARPRRVYAEGEAQIMRAW